jgi:hypothetical protein
VRAEGFEVIEDGSLDGVERCYIHDGFGNRIELIAELTLHTTKLDSGLVVVREEPHLAHQLVEVLAA